MKEKIKEQANQNEARPNASEGAHDRMLSAVNQLGITPAPWRQEEIFTSGISITADNDEEVTHIEYGYDETEPNAKLIAAAPDLYDALKAIQENCEELNIELDHTVFIKMENALKKAAGKNID